MNTNEQKISKRGFTLIELLIVIGILAVLSSAVVVVLNPAQLLAQARDTQRMNDLGTIQSAIALYLTSSSVDTSSATTMAFSGGTCAGNYWTTIAGTALPFATAGLAESTQHGRAVSGGGWVPMNLNLAPGSASPLGTLPVDPSNTTTYFYAYACKNVVTAGPPVVYGKTDFKLMAHMESTIYKNGGSKDVEINTKDGGTNDNFYEVGSNLTL